MQPLSRRFDDDTSLLIDISNARLWLEKGVLLPGSGERIFQYHIGLRKSPGDIPFA